jgi:hypothetical protein
MSSRTGIPLAASWRHCDDRSVIARSEGFTNRHAVDFHPGMCPERFCPDSRAPGWPDPLHSTEQAVANERCRQFRPAHRTLTETTA